MQEWENNYIIDRFNTILNNFYLSTGQHPKTLIVTPLEYVTLHCAMNGWNSLVVPSGASFTFNDTELFAKTDKGVILSDCGSVIQAAWEDRLDKDKLSFALTLPKDLSVDSKTLCNHQWKQYKGFTENYTYCELCDERK